MATSTIALFAQLKSFSYSVNHDIGRLKRDAEHQSKATSSPQILSSESDKFVNRLAVDVEMMIGELEQMQSEVGYKEGRESSFINTALSPSSFPPSLVFFFYNESFVCFMTGYQAILSDLNGHE